MFYEKHPLPIHMVSSAENTKYAVGFGLDPNQQSARQMSIYQIISISLAVWWLIAGLSRFIKHDP